MKNNPSKKKKPGEKLNNISTEYDSVREQTVLLEDMHRDIKAIAEGHGILKQGLDEVRSELKQGLDEVRSDLKRGLAGVRSDLEQGLDGVRSDLKQGLDEVKSDLAVVKSELDTVKVATMENSHRIKSLEVGQQRIEQKLDTVTTDHEHRIIKLEERVLT